VSTLRHNHTIVKVLGISVADFKLVYIFDWSGTGDGCQVFSLNSKVSYTVRFAWSRTIIHLFAIATR